MQFHLEICSKKAGILGSTLSSHCMTTGFGPFELLTCGLLQRGRDYSPPRACFHLRSPALDWLSQYYKYTLAKENGGEAEWVELFITLTSGIGESSTDSCCVSSRPGAASVRFVQCIL